MRTLAISNFPYRQNKNIQLFALDLCFELPANAVSHTFVDNCPFGVIVTQIAISALPESRIKKFVLFLIKHSINLSQKISFFTVTDIVVVTRAENFKLVRDCLLSTLITQHTITFFTT